MSVGIREIKGCGIRPTAHSISSSTSPRSKRGRRFLTPVDFYAFDAEYVRRLCAGEAEVEEHFSLYFEDRLRLKLRSARYDRTENADIIQDTFVRALEKLRNGELRQPQSLGAFVFAICKNICLERSRPRKLEPLSDDYAPASTDDAERDLLETERARALRRAVSQLPAKDRRLLIAYFFEERPKAAICKELGVTPGYLRVCLHRAKKALKRRFLQKFDEKQKSTDEEKDH